MSSPKLNMSHVAFSITILLIGALQISSLATTDKEPTVVVRRATLIAFFPPVTQAEMEKDPDINESLADFQLYAGQVRKPLLDAGIDFHELYVRSFRIQRGKKVETFRTGKVEVGYYFVAPGKKPHIQYGVMTSDNILETAKDYFGVAVNGL